MGRWDYLLAACTGADTMPRISILLRSIDVCTLQCIMTLSGLTGTKVSEMGEVLVVGVSTNIDYGII